VTAGIKANVDGSAAIQVGGVDAITLTSAGAASFVTSPMTIQGGSAAAPSLTFSGDTNTGIFSPAADTIAFSEGGVESMRIDASGNLLIGRTTQWDGEELGITGSASSMRFLYARSTSAGHYLSLGTNGTAPYIEYGNGAGLIFRDGSTERARIDSGGILMVGKTTAGDTVSGFQVSSNGVPVTSCNANSWVFYNTTAGAYRFYVSAAGTINATSTTITAISDQRWKENIRDLDDGLEKILALKPRKFDWKEGKGEDIKNARGFIAQELETVFPDMVTEWIDPAPEGEEPYKAVNANLIPTLVKAIQELKAELDATKAEVALLKGAA
jgi:hypothetical protein